ncbi:MAG TPA: hypothetical protein VF702_09555 [Allosphingosinicella sp.]|jgi:hypothetical protein
MRRILIGVALLGLAGPAAAQRVFTPEVDEDLIRAIPPAEEVEEIGDTMDRVVGAVLDMPIGPLIDAIDAADPEGRRDRRRYPRHATVGDVASDGDPYFEERVRDTIHGSTATVGRTMEQIAIAAPALRRAIGQMERDIEQVMDDARDRRERDRDRRERR